MIIRARQLTRVTPMLEAVLSRVTGGGQGPRTQTGDELFPILSGESSSQT